MNKPEIFVPSSASTKVHSKSCQTDPSEDIPYEITAPLPPIFNSQLCHLSKRIPYLSNSLPNLSTVNWVMITEEDIIEDKAQQALNDQYDLQILDYFEEARGKSRAVRQVYDENCIGKLFEETWSMHKNLEDWLIITLIMIQYVYL